MLILKVANSIIWNKLKFVSVCIKHVKQTFNYVTMKKSHFDTAQSSLLLIISKNNERTFQKIFVLSCRYQSLSLFFNS